MSRKAPTSYDVARLAGVSQSAVSRALSDRGSIAEATRARVLEAARQLGYQPNAIARSMSSARNDPHQKSGMVGVIVTRMQDPFFAHAIAALSREIQARGLQILLFTIDAEDEVDPALTSLMRFQVDGVVILSAILSARMAALCRASGIPVVLFNRDAGSLDVASVVIENRDGGQRAAELLLEGGHRRIAWLAGQDHDTTSHQREEGLVGRLALAGVELFAREAGDYTFVGGREAALWLFARQDCPDALFCASDVMALGVLHALRHDLGLKVPQEVSLVGFDDIPAAAWPGHQLTTIRQPLAQMVRAAAGLLEAMMAEPTRPAETLRFPGTLIVRESCRLPARRDPA